MNALGYSAPALADVFDNQAPEGARERLWQLIRDTPNLDWLLLTKRPQNIARMLPYGWSDGWPNVWLGHVHREPGRIRPALGDPCPEYPPWCGS